MRWEDFAKRVTTIKGESYLVGGAVRDEILGVPVNDRDYCVVGVTQGDFEKEFPEAILQGKDFPVYRMGISGEECEVALARKERKKGAGHKGFEVISSPDVTIEEDLSRRDLTVNAMACRLMGGELVDPFNGSDDIKKGILRHTTEAYKEDPLRVYRTARFASRYGFSVDEGTTKLMHDLKTELCTLSIERVYEEMKKALMTDTPSLFFRALKDADVLDVHFPEIAVLGSYDQAERYHPEGDVFEHEMQVLDAARYFAKNMPKVEGESRKNRYERELQVALSALLHDVGKAVTQDYNSKKGTVTYINHEDEGVPIAKGFLKRFNIATGKKTILYGVKNHMLMHRAIGEMKTSKLVDLIEGKFAMMNSNGVAEKRYERREGIRSAMGIHEFIALCMADTVGRLRDGGTLKQVVALVNEMQVHYTGTESDKTQELGVRLYEIVVDSVEAGHLLEDIETVLRNKKLLEVYDERSKGIKGVRGLEPLKALYSGEDLGYRIHEDKRQQRMKVMAEVRNELK